MKKALLVASVLFVALGSALAAAGAGDSPLSIDQVRQLAGSDHWAVYKNNPLLTLGPPGTWDAGALGSMTLARVGNLYHMYYEAWGRMTKSRVHADYISLQIGHATSPDGVHWTKDPANPVLKKGAGKDWDADGTWDPFVLYEDGVFKMWYGGGADVCNWGYAVSRDGSHFEKKGKISNLGHVEDDHVVHDKATGQYYMFYWDRAQADWDQVMKGPARPSGLFVARSKNETDFDFTHATRLTIEGQPWPAKYTYVFRNRNRWVMFYGEAKLPGNPGRTGMAVSEDLINWKSVAFPLVDGHDAEVIEAAPDLWLMYYGPLGFFDTAGCDIRLAIYQGQLSALAGKK